MELLKEGPQVSTTLNYEPLPAFQASALQDDSGFAACEGKRIGVLIVTYNAITTLISVLKRITPNVWRNVEEVVVFDDASQDGTYELASGVKAVRDLPKLHVLRHPHNLGYGGNQKAGYQYFIERGFDIVVLLHGDGQYAPEILSHLYRPIVKGTADAVFGSRMMKTYGGPLKGGMPLYKFVGNKILTGIENRVLGMKLTEFHSGYRAYNLHALKQIDFSLMTNDFHFDTEIIVKLHHQRLRISEVPIPTYYGDELCRVNGLKYAGNVIRAVWRYKNTCRSVWCAPEFAEYYVNYAIKHGRYSSHSLAVGFVGSRRTVLDIGCGRGAFATELARNGNTVTGIDQYDGLPEGSLAKMYRADLDGPVEPIFEQLQGGKFDRVLLLDVIEHLRQPERILALCHQVLAPGGHVIVSVPNIANITTRFALLFGRFRYADRGILDRTHLRFFTPSTARTILETAGYEIIDMQMTNMPIERMIGFLAPGHRMIKVLDTLLRAGTWCFPGLLGYQTVMVARSTVADNAISPRQRSASSASH